MRHFVKTYKYQVIVLDSLEYPASLKNLDPFRDHPCLKFIHGSITDASLVSRVLKEHSIDAVIHCAAQSHVDNSFATPYDFTHTNVVGTHTVLDEARRYGVKRFLARRP